MATKKTKKAVKSTRGRSRKQAAVKKKSEIGSESGSQDSISYDDRTEKADTSVAVASPGNIAAGDGLATSSKPANQDLLQRLPVVVRQMIWRILVIYPGSGSFSVDGPARWTPRPVIWQTTATSAEVLALEQELELQHSKLDQNAPRKKLCDITTEQYDEKLKRTLRIRFDPSAPLSDPPKLLKQYISSKTGLKGLTILRTCRWISEEVLTILYGENVIDIGPKSSLTERSIAHRSVPQNLLIDQKAWTTFRQTFLIPHTNEHNRAHPEHVKSSLPQWFTIAQLDHLFDRTPPVARYDNPLATFCREIGPMNSWRIRSLVISADLWSELVERGAKYPYTHLLRTMLRCLRTLTLEQSARTKSGWSPDDLHSFIPDSEKTERQGKMDEKVGQIVKDLPYLNELRLRVQALGSFDDAWFWGKAMRWIDVVKERALKED